SSRVSSPGSANTWRTPSFSRQATTSCATFTAASLWPAALFGACGLRRLLRGADPDRLDVHEFADAERGELAAVAAALHAAEWQPWVRRDHPVDEHRARLDAPGERAAAVQVGRPQRRAEPVRRA